ncbi:MAG: hypothetical protein MJA82_06295 [Clostridia bacterium]|nr:hypothetical protein [Clostridia bacterium]
MTTKKQLGFNYFKLIIGTLKTFLKFKLLFAGPDYAGKYSTESLIEGSVFYD